MPWRIRHWKSCCGSDYATLNHHANSDFWTGYRALPHEVQALADKAYLLLKQNPYLNAGWPTGSKKPPSIHPARLSRPISRPNKTPPSLAYPRTGALKPLLPEINPVPGKTRSDPELTHHAHWRAALPSTPAKWRSPTACPAPHPIDRRN